MENTYFKHSITQKIIKNNKLKGKFVAFSHKNILYIGWSLCNKKDKFDLDMMNTVAYSRAINTPDKTFINIPHSIREDYKRFYDRCCRYFKSIKPENWPKWTQNNNTISKDLPMTWNAAKEFCENLNFAGYSNK